MQQVSQDLLWKELISEFFEEFMEFFFPHIHEEIEFSAGVENLTTELGSIAGKSKKRKELFRKY